MDWVLIDCLQAQRFPIGPTNTQCLLNHPLSFESVLQLDPLASSEMQLLVLSVLGSHYYIINLCSHHIPVIGLRQPGHPHKPPAYWK